MAFAGNSCLMKITIGSYKYKQFIVVIKKKFKAKYFSNTKLKHISKKNLFKN